MADKLHPELQKLIDLEEIRALKYAYCHFNDGGWPKHGGSHEGPAYQLFTEDGVWDSSPVGPRVEGREAIRELMESYREKAPYARHTVTNPRIEISGDTATGNWHAMIYSTVRDITTGQDTDLLGLGEYDDVYVRTSEGWRIKSLKFTPARMADMAYFLPLDGGSEA